MGKYFGLIRNGFWKQYLLIKRYHMQNAYEAFKEFQELFGYLVADEAQVVTGGTFLIDGTVDYISNVKKLVK